MTRAKKLKKFDNALREYVFHLRRYKGARPFRETQTARGLVLRLLKLKPKGAILTGF